MSLRTNIKMNFTEYQSSSSPIISENKDCEVELITEFDIIEWNLPHYRRKSLDKNPVSSSVLAHRLPLEKSLWWSTEHRPSHSWSRLFSRGRGCVRPSEFPLLLSTLLPGLDSSLSNFSRIIHFNIAMNYSVLKY